MGKPSWYHACVLVLPINTTIDPRENFSNRVKNCKNCKRFCLETFAVFGIMFSDYVFCAIVTAVALVSNALCISSGSGTYANIYFYFNEYPVTRVMSITNAPCTCSSSSSICMPYC